MSTKVDLQTVKRTAMMGDYKESEFMPTVAIAHADQVGGVMDILEKWAQELKRSAVAMGYPVIDIGGSDLTYESLTQIIQATKPEILFFFGFGDKTHLIGNDMKPVITSQNVVGGTSVIAYSSHAASQLGPALIKVGSSIFVGFSDSLITVSGYEKEIFKESLLPLAKRILQGWTVGAAVEATRSDMLNAINQHKYKYITVPLFFNLKSLKYLGDPNWKLKAGGN